MKGNLTSGLLGEIISYLKWVDTWKKVFLVSCLTSIVISGVVIWENRQTLVTAFSNLAGEPEINDDKLEPEMSAIMRDTDAVALVVWSVSLERNYRQAIYVNVNNRKISQLEETSDIVLRLHVREAQEIIKLLDANVSCWPYTGRTEVGLEAISAGVKWVCATKVPPSYGGITGIIAAGFSRQPDNEDFIKVRLINAAENIIK
ncbi:TPA: hypothetical protein QHN47_004789 [Klebsiella aerogenes]|nr:hypothetical protein [Klebsiella aerogenes]